MKKTDEHMRPVSNKAELTDKQQTLTIDARLTKLEADNAEMHQRLSIVEEFMRRAS